MTHTNITKKTTVASANGPATTSTLVVYVRHGMSLDDHLTTTLGWRSGVGKGNSPYRKTGASNAIATGRRARRKIARLEARAAKKGGRNE